ncbi:NYN domain-containing protein [Tabrizicola sp.]|uniref:NYN domain-containing protein n=1 Tax=Tabrizicola sp. TaxID=2005166 RepID=UPI002FDE0FB8
MSGSDTERVWKPSIRAEGWNRVNPASANRLWTRGGRIAHPTGQSQDDSGQIGFAFCQSFGKTFRMFGLPLLQHFVPAVTSSASAFDGWEDSLVQASFVVLVVAGLVFCVHVLLRGQPRRSRRPKRGGHEPRRQRPSNTAHPPSDSRQAILIDGSNVIYWLDNTPQLAPLLQVVHDLSRRGLKPGVVFDANVGYKLTGEFMGERDLSRLLSLPMDQILVVPKGKQADPFLLETARDLKARIVTNDRYRDWTERYPDVARPARLVTGGMRDGKVWLQGLDAKEDAL